MASNPENVRLTVLMKLQEALDEEAILEEQMLALMHRFADRFTDRRVEINNLMVLHDHPLIDYGTTSHDLWLSLEKAYAPHSTSREYTLKTQLLRIEMHGDETPDAYLNRAQEYVDALATIGEPVKDKDLVMLVISDTGNSHVTPDLEAMDNSEAYYGDDALHVGN
ncbi:hypothetical protein Tco_0323324, partial [Tanacetum coccineum]